MSCISCYNVGTFNNGEPRCLRQPQACNDFDFLVGHWQVRHRRLKERLRSSREWIEFDGTSIVSKLMGGCALVDDNVLDFPPGAYRAAGLRSFDAAPELWSIWWLDSRTPLGPLDPPVRGRFREGVGTFLADETFKGRPIRARFTWSQITPTSAHLEQAFSPDERRHVGDELGDGLHPGASESAPDHVHGHFAPMRPQPMLPQIDALPGAEREAPAGDRNR